MSLQAKKLGWITISDNLASLVISLIFIILTINCLFIDKGYYDTMPQDLFGFFDGIYRLYLGQVPNRDFSTTYGIFVYLIPSLFLNAGADLVSSVTYYHVTLLIVAMCIVMYIQRTRLESIISILFATAIALALACKYNFGDSPFQVTEAMFYNRIGFTFLSLEIALLIKPTLENVEFLTRIDAVLIGLVCGFLFYIKFTFGLVALGFVFFNLLADDRTWRSKLTLLGASVALFIFILVIIEFGYGTKFALYRDVRMAMLSDSGHRIAIIILRRLLLDIPEIVIAIVAPLIILRLAMIKIRPYWTAYALSIAFASIILQVYSFQESVLFLPLAFILFAMSKLQRYNNTSEPDRLLYFVAMISISFLATANIVYPMIINVAVSSVRYHNSRSELLSANEVLSRIRTIPLQKEATYTGKILSAQAVDTVNRFPALDAFMWARKSRPLYYYDDLSFPEYEFYLADGLKAATSGCRKGARIATLDSVNPFPALLGWPEGGGMIFVGPPSLVSESHHLSAEEMFRQIDCVLVPKIQAATGVREFLTNVYGKYLDANYVKTKETVLWTVLTPTK
jgi:hypothetical protein